MGAENVLWMVGAELDIEGGPVVTNIEPLRILDRRLSSLMHCRVTTDDGREILVWAKLHKPSDPPEIKQLGIVRDFDLNSRLYGAIDGGGRFLVPRPVYHSPEHRLIVTEDVDGAVLQGQIEASARGCSVPEKLGELKQHCRLAGGWLRSFQARTQGYCPGQDQGCPPMKVKGASRIVEQTIARLNQLVEQDRRVFAPDFLQEIEAFLRRNLADHRIDEKTICSIHGDYFAGNLIVDGDKIAGLDFESATWGSPLFDVGYFVFQLQTFQEKLRYRNLVIEQLIDEFLEGYGLPARHQEFWAHHPMFRILFISHAVSRLLSLVNCRPMLSPRCVYRKFIARRLISKLKSHVAIGE